MVVVAKFGEQQLGRLRFVEQASTERDDRNGPDHLGRLVRDGKTPNAGRPGAPRIALKDLPRNAHGPSTPRPAVKPRCRGLSNRQTVQPIVAIGIE